MHKPRQKIKVKLPIRPQPDDVTCGPTCLHSIYGLYQDNIILEDVINQVQMLDTGGTYASWLGVHALKRGYHAEIWSFNLNIFDPTWFGLPEVEIYDKLKRQFKAKKNRKLRAASDGYMEFIKNGGKLRFDDLTLETIEALMFGGGPLIVGLSATYLYKSMREVPTTDDYDDINGLPSGHFVVLTGLDPEARTVQITDPNFPNKLSVENTYTVSIARLIASILLGVVTYDANLLLIARRETVA